MRQCTKCMAQNNDRAKYCSQCGYMLTPPQATNKGDKLAALSFINSNTWILRYLYLRGNVFFPFLSFV